MSNKPVDLDRRKTLKIAIAAGVLVPAGALLTGRHAAAADLPPVSEDDPVAVSLQYKHDATQAARVDKAGTPAEEQICSNCQLAQGDGEWVACSVFPGKAVNANGWCTAWVPNA